MTTTINLYATQAVWTDRELAEAGACHLCEEPLLKAPVVGTVARGGRPSRRVACTRCGLVQVEPPPSVEELDRYYRTAYHTEHGPVTLVVGTRGPDGSLLHTESVAPGSPRYDATVNLMHESRARFIRDDLQLPAGSRVLEVGGSDGRTARELERLGLIVDVVEPDPEKAALARERLQGDVLVGTLEDAVEARSGYGYDAVISFHVLEHFLDPLRALKAMRGLLRPGGWVWAEVPDTMRAEAPLVEHWQWVHIFDLNAHALAALFLRAGLGTVDVQQVPPAHLHARGRECGIHGRTFPHAAFEVEGAPYAMDDAPSGESVARHLASVGMPRPASVPDGAEFMQRWLEGASLMSLADPNVEVLIRRAFADVQRDVLSREQAWDQSIELLAKMGDGLRRDAVDLLESWAHEEEDPETRGFINGMAMGRGEERIRAAKMLAHVANAMRRRETVG